MEDSLIITDWVNEGIVLQTDCSKVAKNTLFGNLVLRRNTIRGQRYLPNPYPFVYFLSFNNMTITGNVFRNFATNDDANKFGLYVDTPLVCSGMTVDNLNRSFIYANNYISSDSSDKEAYVGHYFVFTPKTPDKAAGRTNSIVFENITAEHLYSRIWVLNINSGPIDVVSRNLIQNNVTATRLQATQIIFSGTSSISIYNSTFMNCNSYTRIVLVFSSQLRIYANGLRFINNTSKNWLKLNLI